MKGDKHCNMDSKKFIIGGEFKNSSEVREIKYPYTDETISSVFLGTRQDTNDAIHSAQEGSKLTRLLSSHQRATILNSIADSLGDMEDLIIETLINEGGKTYAVAKTEVTRSRETLKNSAEEAKRIFGEIISLDGSPGGEGYTGYVKRIPVGIVLGITPFNYPLNLACHKIGPAIASGNAIILKPSSKTPLSSLILGKIIIDAGFPKKAISVIPCDVKNAEEMVRDIRIGYVSFTGSSPVGWHLKSICSRRIGLELGGNAGVVIHNDADIRYAVKRICYGGFGNAGQSCISVQRVFVQEEIYDNVLENLTMLTKNLVIGDPHDPHTDIGPMISIHDTQRAMHAIHTAEKNGATILCGGSCQGSTLKPTILIDTKPNMAVNNQEMFAPIITITPYTTFDHAIHAINQSSFGLQAGVFTTNLDLAFQAYNDIEAGAVIINDIPTFRIDSMPYGGMKQSGIGREGPRYAIEEMTELKMMVLHQKIST